MYAYAAAQIFVEVLKQAGKNPTRASLLKAAESIKDFKAVALEGGVTMTPTDHAAIHCERMIRYDQSGNPKYVGDPICAPIG
jgi:ABC-type branched-subunit amino acid transport system substrate-binding protein